MSDAIECPECGKTATRVVESKPDYKRGSVRRRRKCGACGCRWTTYEVDQDRLNLLEDSLKTRRRI